MSQTPTESSPILSVEPLDDDLATVTVLKHDGSTMEYVASRHSAADKIRDWEAQPLRGVPTKRPRIGFRGAKG